MMKTKTVTKIISIVCILMCFSCQKDKLDLLEENMGLTEKNGAVPLVIEHSGVVLEATKIANKKLPSARNGHASVVYNNQMWIIGGESNGIAKNEVLTSTDGTSWTVVKSKNPFPPRFRHALVVFQNKMWIIGGATYDKDGNYYEFNDIWSSANGIDWELETLEADFPTRASHTVTLFNNALWLIGGLGVSQSEAICCGYSDIWRSTDGINWTLIDASAPFERRVSDAAIVFDGKLWITGRTYGGGPHRIWYSANGTDWDHSETLPVFPERWGHTLVSDGEAIWLSAGWRALPDNNIWFSTNGLDWFHAETTKDFPKRYRHTSLFFNNKLWIIQGRGYGRGRQLNFTSLNDIWSFERPDSPFPITDFNSK